MVTVSPSDGQDRRRDVTVDSRASGLGSSLPTMSVARSRAVTPAGSTVATVVPRRITVICVGDGEHLVELVRDEDDREPLAGQLPEIAEELVDLLRDQHRGRLVQDDDRGRRGRAP